MSYPLIQATPELLELVGCYVRGKAKRTCVLFSPDGDREFYDDAIKNGASFLPKLKEVLSKVKPLGTATVSPPRPAVKKRGKAAQDRSASTVAATPQPSAPQKAAAPARTRLKVTKGAKGVSEPVPEAKGVSTEVEKNAPKTAPKARAKARAKAAAKKPVGPENSDIEEEPAPPVETVGRRRKPRK